MKALRWLLPLVILFGLGYYTASDSNKTPTINKDIVKAEVEYKSITAEELLIISKNCNAIVGSTLKEISEFGDDLIIMGSNEDDFADKLEIFQKLKSQYLLLDKPSDPICTVALSPADSYLSTTNYLLNEKMGK